MDLTTEQAMGAVFRELREGPDPSRPELTQEQMAAKLRSVGVNIYTRGGISRLEERGTTQHRIVKAYCTLFGISVEKIETLAEAHRQTAAVA